ncbi:unnamed protein product [Anisakis simplex]|uniref:CXXC-type zinc finger protein 1 n=1 Tax=Anisakis simplex TaxID=6269 RepID=A0A0M3KGF9_ANISI|nr:unnamed protein product [Anisakis simplex]
MKHGNWSTDDESSKGGSTNSFSTNTTGSQHPAIGGAQKGKRGRKKGWRKGKNEKDSSKDHYASVRAKGGAMNNDIVSYGTDRTFTLDERRHIASATYRACTRRNAPVEKIKEDPKQCFGPGCTKASRFNSKYCSDECGMRLARKRLEMVLPGRVSDFYDQLPNATARSMRLRAALEQRIQQLSNETRILASYRAEVHRWISLCSFAFLQTITDYEPVEEDDDKGSSDTDFMKQVIFLIETYG